MTLQIRDFPTIAASLISEMVALTQIITDYTEGAVARSILEAFATELQRQDVAIYQGVREGIEVGTYRNFDFFRLPASFANGLLRYTRVDHSTEFTVPIGHLTRVPGSNVRVYQTTRTVSFPINVDVVDIPVRCTVAGAVGNTPSNTVVEVVDVLGLDLTVTNVSPFLTGVDQENDDDRRNRFRLFIQGLSKGTRIAIEFAARSVTLLDGDVVVERVTGVLVREPFRDDPEGMVGHIEVYVDNGAGTSSAALLAKVRDVIQGFVDEQAAVQRGYVAAGIDFDVFAVQAVPLDVSVRVTLFPGFVAATVKTEVQAAITAYLSGLQVFETAIFAELVSAAMNVDGVADVAFLSPTANIEPVIFSDRIVPGSVVVTS